MDFSVCIPKWGTVDFDDSIQTLLRENEGSLPLDDLCEAGGGPDWESWAEFTVDDSEEDDDCITITCSVYFNESIPGGCRDINNTEKRQGKLIIEIDKKTGDADITADPDSERFNPEYYRSLVREQEASRLS